MAESYTGLDSISVIKQFSPAPRRQTEFFKLDKKHSAELEWSSCCVNTFVCLGLGKARYWPLVAPIKAVRGILNQTERSGLFFPTSRNPCGIRTGRGSIRAGAEAGSFRVGRGGYAQDFG